MVSCPRAREDTPRPRMNLCLSLMPGLFLSLPEPSPYRAAEASQPENGVTCPLCPRPSLLDSPCTIRYVAANVGERRKHCDTKTGGSLQPVIFCIFPGFCGSVHHRARTNPQPIRNQTGCEKRQEVDATRERT